MERQRLIAILSRTERGSVRRTLQDIDHELVARMREHAMAYATSTPVRQVAVVANAPLEPSEERRDLIDSSDLVVRVNSLALDRPGEPASVGTRTNVVVAARTTRPTPGFLSDYRNRAYFVTDVFHLTRPDPPGWPSYWPPDLAPWPVPNRAIGIPLKFLLHPGRGGQRVSPTTGTLAAYLAYRLFPDARIVLTGFSYLRDRDQKSWGYHQAGLRHSPVHSSHNLDREGAFLQGFVDRGEVRYVA
jgi:hypothetical protein